jgi:Flp pilus assembly protein TadB
MKRKQRAEEALRSVESAMDKLRRASRKNEKAAGLHLKRRRIYALAGILEPDLDIDEPDPSGLHDTLS